MKEKEINDKIKEFAIEVYKNLGGGYSESVYEEAMAVEMRNAKMSYDVEVNTEIMYKNNKVGTHRLDFTVERKVVVELKASGSISKGNRSQLKAYLNTLGMKRGLLINFPYPDMEEPIIEEISI